MAAAVPATFSNMVFSLRIVRRLWRDERGQDFIEYALLAAIIAIAGVLVLPALGARLGTVFNARETPVCNLWVPDCPIATPCPPIVIPCP